MFRGTGRNSYQVTGIRLVDNPDRRLALLLHLKQLLALRSHPGGPMRMPPRPQDPLRVAALNKLTAHFTAAKSFEPFCHLLFTWAGFKQGVVEAVVRNGFVNVRVTDDGYFGSGVYSALEAPYACSYAVNSECQADEHEVVLIATAVGVAYCIVNDGIDYPLEKQGLSRFYGQVALEQPYDSHFIPVRLDPEQPHLSYQACKAGETAEYHELVVGEAAAMCPVAVVRFREVF